MKAISKPKPLLWIGGLMVAAPAMGLALSKLLYPYAHPMSSGSDWVSWITALVWYLAYFGLFLTGLVAAPFGLALVIGSFFHKEKRLGGPDN